MVIKGFPNVISSGQQYNFGEKPTVILCTNIIHHVGTPKRFQYIIHGLHFLDYYNGLRISNYNKFVISKIE